MWIFILIVVVLIVVCLLLNFKRLELQKRVDSILPMLEVVENVKDILYYCDVRPSLKYRYLSPVVDQYFGKGKMDEHIKNPDIIFCDLVHPDDRHILEKKKTGELDYSKPIVTRLKNKEGNYIWFEEYATPIYNQDGIIAVQGILRNISEKIELQQKLEYKITHDALTNIYNRGFFESQLEYYNSKSDIPIAILICDLDDLKLVNDHFGHKAGDILIQETARLLEETASKKEIVARIGGDEFAVIFIDTELVQIEKYLSNLQTEVDSFNSKSSPFQIKISVGFAYSPLSIGKMDMLFLEADQKMYVDKNEKKQLHMAI